MKVENYTSVCWYCGSIFRSNRSTSKFCNGKHRSLYHKHGPCICPLVVNKDGQWINADEKFAEVDYNLYKVQAQGWSYFYNLDSIIYKYNYEGPLPKGDEILIVGSFAIIRLLENHDEEKVFFGVKHISRLTIEEKGGYLILKG